MTNEQLAKAIKTNKNNRLIFKLWNNVRKLIYIKCDKYYFSLNDRFKASGIDIWDLRQEMYFAFLEALKAYDPDKNFKFVTYLEFPIKNAVKKALGIGCKFQPLNNSESLDKPVAGQEELTLSDMITDEKDDILKIIRKNTDSEIIRNEVEKLHGKQKNIIVLYYFNDKNDGEIARYLATTPSNIFQMRRRALAGLKKSPVLNFIYYSDYAGNYI